MLSRVQSGVYRPHAINRVAMPCALQVGRSSAATGVFAIKRVLVWGSYVTAKEEPNDLDYSIVVSIDHVDALIAAPHRR